LERLSEIELVIVGAGIVCYVCNSGEKYDGENCEHIPDDGSGREYLRQDCDKLSTDKGWPERNYTLCRKFIQDGTDQLLTVRQLPRTR